MNVSVYMGMITTISKIFGGIKATFSDCGGQSWPPFVIYKVFITVFSPLCLLAIADKSKNGFRTGYLDENYPNWSEKVLAMSLQVTTNDNKRPFMVDKIALTGDVTGFFTLFL